jgi:thiamine-phosphate pyrophosphorylase
MFFELTPAADRALDAARRRALADSAEAISPRHLLFGLLDETEGRAAGLLVRHGLDLSAWRSAQPPHPLTEMTGSLPNAPAAERALTEAHGLARRDARDQPVSTEHVLLAILQAEASLLRELTEHGLRFEDLERARRAEQPDALPLEGALSLDEAVEQSDAARILDANANRAREALRVLEDYCRFSLDDAFLSRQLKELRHNLAETLNEFRPTVLLSARDTLADVGTGISTPSEQTRYSLRAVVEANVKRLQEALRSLEEYGKLYGSVVGQQLEGMRYRAYTLERALLLGADARARLADARLYVLLTGATCRAALDWTIAEAAAGGADVFQLREKTLPDRELLQRARDVRRWTRQAGVLFIVNDRPDIARLAEADGVHLGQGDLPVREARRILGPDALVGVSTHNLEQVRRAVLEGASYIGVGPTFPSTTKDFAELAGLEFVRAVTAETSLPAFVLGGVTAANVGRVAAAGGRRVAVSAAVAQADDPRAAAAALRAALL